MVATLCLFTCALATAQPAGSSEWQLAPRLSRGQELVYSGSFTEEADGKGVQFQRAYRLENRVFILEASSRGLDVAFLTILRPKTAAPERGATAPSSVRLELAQVDPQGKTNSSSGRLAPVPLEGPPTAEWGAFVHVTRARVAAGRTWEVTEEGRPARSWQVAGTEMVNGTRCVKVVGVQQSDDWDRPRADRVAWRRRDVVWMVPNLGIACQVERTVERREPLRTEPTHRSITRYQLESRVVYPAQLYDDRRVEILQVRALADTFDALLREPEKKVSAAFDGLLAKVAYHLDNRPTTPYREALVQLKRRVEAARRGEAIPEPIAEDEGPIVTVAALGRLAPDFVVTDFTNTESVRLRKILGRPILMVFYSPTSRNATEILHFAQDVQARHHDDVKVLAFAVSDDKEHILNQRAELKLTLPVLSGLGLRLTYAVEATPKFVILDAAGVVRGSFVGWGQETTGLVNDEVKLCLRPTEGR